MSVFERALSQLSATEQLIVRSRMQKWLEACRTGAVVVRNIDDKEHFLPEPQMAVLLTSFLRSHNKEDDYLREEFKRSCRESNMKLAGRKLETRFEPLLLGRAVEYDTFVSDLMRTPYCTTKEGVEALLDDLRDHNHILTAAQERILIDQYLSWSTFSLESPDIGPFSFTDRTEADVFRAAIGLSREYRSIHGLILLVYNKPDDLELYRPTVADAELYEHFEPPRKSENRCGFTKPWDPGTTGLPVDEEDRILKPRPECVHVPVELSNLCIPIEIVS